MKELAVIIIAGTSATAALVSVAIGIFFTVRYLLSLL